MSDSRRPPTGEFAEQIGESQSRGSPGLTGLGPPQQPSEVGIAPPSPLQVQSVFDTRPLSAFDFAFDTAGRITEGGAPLLLNADIPDGYTAVLRRLEIEATPGFLGQTIAGGGYVTTAQMQVQLLRDGSPIPWNLVVFRNALGIYSWHTHQVFGFWQSMGAQFVIVPPTLTGAFDIGITARFFGVLIPSRSLPPTEEVGSDPVLVRQYVGVTGRGEIR